MRTQIAGIRHSGIMLNHQSSQKLISLVRRDEFKHLANILANLKYISMVDLDRPAKS